jgi:hypothetical protein
MLGPPQAREADRPVLAPHVPLLVAGGGERITLRQVAQHADACTFGPPRSHRERLGPAGGLAQAGRARRALRRRRPARGSAGHRTGAS